MIDSKFVQLRFPKPDDYRQLTKWHNENSQYFFGNELISLESHLDWWYKRIRLDMSQRLFVVTIPLEHAAIYGESCETGELLTVGTIGLTNIDFCHRHARCSRFLIAEKYRGKGYGKGALLALLHFAFVTLELHKVYGEVLFGNLGALSLCESLGFHQVGVLPDHAFKEGKFLDVTRIAVSTTTWNGFKEATEL